MNFNCLPFFPGRMKIEKVEKLVSKACIIKKICHQHKKQALNLELVLKKCIESLNSIKPYIDMNKDLRKKQKIISKKIFLSC